MTTVPGQSSPPPTLTPRLGAMSLTTVPLGLALDDRPAVPSTIARALSAGAGSSTSTGARHPSPEYPAAHNYAHSERPGPESGSPVPSPVPDESDDSRSPSPALTVSNGPTSPPSASGSLAAGSGIPSPHPSTSSTSLSIPTTASSAAPVPKAEVGFGSLHAEEELRKALSSKDRMFVLMVGKDYEAFITRVLRGEITTRVPPCPASAASASTSLMDSLGPSKKIDVPMTSKYQRMLAYKLAEWYGLRAAPGVDGVMVVGVLGTLDERSSGLRISTVVPEMTAPQTQTFRLLQRETPSVGDEDSGSRATSVSGDDGTEQSGPRSKTLEERTLAYALARKRIIGDDDGDDDSTSASASSLPRSRQASRFGDDENDVDPVPRRAYPSDFEFVYPSLYHTSDGQATPAVQGVPPPQAAYAYPGMQPPYQGYMPQGMGYPDSRQYAMGPYPNAPYGAQVPMGGYPQWQQPGIPGPPMMPPQMTPQMAQQMGGMGGGQMAMMAMAPQGWPYPSDMGMAHATPANMMPMIPQGMPYPNMGYQTSQGPTLAQPVPMRAGVDPLSSTSSSISSRSYQDVQSRPHSRGSTTSTRSAASSVRLGAIYPTSQQSYGFRQKAVKGQQTNYAPIKSMGVGFEGKRNGRQSPASTTSSRSSRRTSSIHITQPQPGQHPLPQRPDWAANNVPYHPSPMPLSPGAEPSTSDFPPLLRAPLNAEPMQVEKVKMRPSNGTVWNGSAARSIHSASGQHEHASEAGSSSHAQSLASPPHSHSHATPHQSPVLQQHQPAQSVPAVSILPNPHKQQPPPSLQLQPDADPDFPRRMPSSRTPALYDPSAPRAPSARMQQQQSQQSQGSQPQSPAVAPSFAHVPGPPTNAPSAPPAADIAPPPVQAPAPPTAVAVDDVEVRVAALSVKGSVAVAPASQATPARGPPSYAKIVRRD